MTTEHATAPPSGPAAGKKFGEAQSVRDGADTHIVGGGHTATQGSGGDSAAAAAAAAASAASAPPDSPPLPARHTAVTPGPKAARLQELFASSLAHTLAKISWDNFAACYPTIAARAPGTLKHVQKQMVDRLGQLCNVRLGPPLPFPSHLYFWPWMCLIVLWLGSKALANPLPCLFIQEEFERVLQNRNVVPKLNELESIFSDAARRREGHPEGQPPPIPYVLLPTSLLQYPGLQFPVYVSR